MLLFLTHHPPCIAFLPTHVCVCVCVCVRARARVFVLACILRSQHMQLPERFAQNRRRLHHAWRGHVQQLQRRFYHQHGANRVFWSVHWFEARDLDGCRFMFYARAVYYLHAAYNCLSRIPALLSMIAPVRARTFLLYHYTPHSYSLQR